MTAILPPYSGENTICVKCGHDYARTTYRPKLDPGQLIAHHVRGVAVEDRDQERLCRECARCDHHWDEATVDGDKPEPERRACHLVHDHDGHEPHTWTDVDGNWLSCPGSGPGAEESVLASVETVAKNCRKLCENWAWTWMRTKQFPPAVRLYDELYGAVTDTGNVPEEDES